VERISALCAQNGTRTKSSSQQPRRKLTRGPRRVGVAAERVEHERKPVLLPGRLQVAWDPPKDIRTHFGLEVLPVARDVRQRAGVELRTDLPKDR